jgi:hypothetical protein
MGINTTGTGVKPGPISRAITARMNDLEWVKMAFRAYSEMPELIGCQVKMILGLDCFANKNVTHRMADLAVERLREVTFIGITDFYKETVEKFHKKFLPKSTNPIHDLELQNSRMMRAKYKEAKEMLLNDKYGVDPYDQKLYTRALKIFLKS